MSAKNSLKAKQTRREQREDHKENTDHSQTKFKLIPLPNGGYSRYLGECPTCYLRKEINRHQSIKQVNLEHTCRLEFLTTEQYKDLNEAVRLYVEKIKEETEEDEPHL